MAVEEYGSEYLDIGVLDVDASTAVGHVQLCKALFDCQRAYGVEATALVCGPEIMMTVTAERLMEGYSMKPQSIYVTMERNMKCGIGVCGHCQFGSKFICTDGAVFSFDEVGHLFDIKGV